MRPPRRWTGCCFAIAAGVLSIPVSANSACAPAGTPGDDTVVCTGTDTVGVSGGDGRDVITIQSGAAITTISRQEVHTASAHATTLTIDAGTGVESVVNRGTVVATTVAVSQGGAPYASATALAIGAGIPWFAGGGGVLQAALTDLSKTAAASFPSGCGPT